jgi:hypothetical protein
MNRADSMGEPWQEWAALLNRAAIQGDAQRAQVWLEKLRESAPDEALARAIDGAARSSARCGQPATLMLLLPNAPQEAARLDALDPLMAAAQSGSLECVKILAPWHSGASTFEGRCALSMAIEADAFECAMFLAQGPGGKLPGPLFDAVSRDWGELCSALAASGQGAARDGFGDTALHVAAALGKASACEALIEFYDPDALGGRRQSCARAAFEHGHEALAAWLRNASRVRKERDELARLSAAQPATPATRPRL